LEDFDYSQNGVYFVTICVKDRMPVLSKIPENPVGADIPEIVQQLKGLLQNRRRASNARPTADIPQIVQQLKGIITKQCGRAIWQKSFYDHVIRDEQDYLDIWAYIENNPEKWVEDKMYVKD